MNDGIISCSDMIMKTVDITAFDNGNNISSVWKKVVSKIHNYEDSEEYEKRIPLGERLAGNTRVVDLKKGVLLVEADHPGWIQYLRMYQKFILNGLKMNLPELQIKSLAFKITGTQAKLSDVYNEQIVVAKQKLSEKIDNQDKILEKFFEKEDENKIRTTESKLPPELLEKFDSIKQSMLTNIEK